MTTLNLKLVLITINTYVHLQFSHFRKRLLQISRLLILCKLFILNSLLNTFNHFI